MDSDNDWQNNLELKTCDAPPHCIQLSGVDCGDLQITQKCKSSINFILIKAQQRKYVIWNLGRMVWHRKCDMVLPSSGTKNTFSSFKAGDEILLASEVPYFIVVRTVMSLMFCPSLRKRLITGKGIVFILTAFSFYTSS